MRKATLAPLAGGLLAAGLAAPTVVKAARHARCTGDGGRGSTRGTRGGARSDLTRGHARRQLEGDRESAREERDMGGTWRSLRRVLTLPTLVVPAAVPTGPTAPACRPTPRSRS